MKIDETKQLKIKLKGDDADQFKSIINKLSEKGKEIGFSKKPFSVDETKLIAKLKEKF